MDLFYILLNQHEFSAQYCIYAELPWTLQSRAIMIEAYPSPSPTLNIDATDISVFHEFGFASTAITDLFKPEPMPGRDLPTYD